MLAARVHERGGTELVIEEIPLPSPGADEALIRVGAAGVSPDEFGWSTFCEDEVGNSRLPSIPSHEFSGTIVEIGGDLDDAAVGDEVFGLGDFWTDGAAAEYVLAKAQTFSAKLARLDHVHAAAMPLSALTAHQALVNRAEMQSDQRLLVHGAAGGVGSFAVQLSAHLGATVFATASGADREFVRGLGAEESIDYSTERFEDRVSEVDVVFDMVGGTTLERSWAA